MHTYYAVKTGPDCYDMRQTRYKERLAAGAEHPYDVCAFGFTADQLRTLVKDHSFDCDLSALEPQQSVNVIHTPEDWAKHLRGWAAGEGVAHLSREAMNEIADYLVRGAKP